MLKNWRVAYGEIGEISDNETMPFPTDKEYMEYMAEKQENKEEV